MKNSDIATLDASNWTYEFEKAEIKNVEQGDLLDFVQEKAKSKIPSNLEFIDNDHNKATGTSGTAFLDKNTDEIIIDDTGTNKDGNAVQDIIGADLGFG
ncbi:hypothetical protein [Streptococcus thoraltensis]|uniref:hypothetical protein n=1 Tax=Streptococcus thoraltensis TaxID=55085 RepID=UPI000372ECD1|nr:hypothetical protein [Streptococcus thoraltensis]